MIPGSEAKRGLLSRRSTVTTAGNVSSSVSTPPSISRATWRLAAGGSDEAGAPRLLRLALQALLLGGERRLRPGEPTGEDLAGLVLVVVDRLLAEEHEIGPLLQGHLLEERRGRTRVERPVVPHEDAAIGAHGERRASSLTDVAPPIETTTTSPPCASRRRSASSTAISSKGFIL